MKLRAPMATFNAAARATPIPRRPNMSLRKGPMPLPAKVLFWLIGFPLVLMVYGLFWLFATVANRPCRFLALPTISNFVLA
jgi:hypothetical protein